MSQNSKLKNKNIKIDKKSNNIERKWTLMKLYHQRYDS